MGGWSPRAATGGPKRRASRRSRRAGSTGCWGGSAPPRAGRSEGPRSWWGPKRSQSAGVGTGRRVAGRGVNEAVNRTDAGGVHQQWCEQAV
eukprot:6354451-Prymnesium_polylepis.1